MAGQPSGLGCVGVQALAQEFRLRPFSPPGMLNQLPTAPPLFRGNRLAARSPEELAPRTTTHLPTPQVPCTPTSPAWLPAASCPCWCFRTSPWCSAWWRAESISRAVSDETLHRCGRSRKGGGLASAGGQSMGRSHMDSALRPRAPRWGSGGGNVTRLLCVFCAGAQPPACVLASRTAHRPGRLPLPRAGGRPEIHGGLFRAAGGCSTAHRVPLRACVCV